ncbi:uncharacterized protein LOC131949801 [Physella acuta]|uniref:uncharacterized protein LOC131949801 n=1 Tax=Physella acuta TaxID=109671 RepID=UPI0027DB6130|nr:uncharacterized protein LOC131949801 [Physella acuta]
MSYMIHKVLVAGRFGSVYHLHSLTSGTLTLKVMDKTTTEVAERDIRDGVEVAIARLQHPHIVRCLGYHIDDNRRLMLLLEPVKCTLKDKISDAYLPVIIKDRLQPKHINDMLSWFSQMADGLNFLHSKNICHRDLRTDNVFVSAADQIKLGVIGVLKKQEIEARTFKFFGGLQKEPCYMGPEIFSNVDYTLKTDIWALGCIFYEVFYREPAFTFSEARKIYKKKIVSSVVYGNKDLCQLIESMLCSECTKRLSATEVLTQLRKMRQTNSETQDNFSPFIETNVDWEKVKKTVKKYNNPEPKEHQNDSSRCTLL